MKLCQLTKLSMSEYCVSIKGKFCKVSHFLQKCHGIKWKYDRSWMCLWLVVGLETCQVSGASNHNFLWHNYSVCSLLSEVYVKCTFQKVLIPPSVSLQRQFFACSVHLLVFIVTECQIKLRILGSYVLSSCCHNK
jgi:hypothetical protein